MSEKNDTATETTASPLPAPERHRADSGGRRSAPRIGSDGTLAISAWLAVFMLALAGGGALQISLHTLKAPLVALVIGAVASVLSGRSLGSGVKEWWPLVMMVALYTQLDPYTQLFHHGSLDAQLLAIDEFLLGSSPSESLAAIHNPWLTELFALAYASYLILPLGAAAPVFFPTEDGRMRHRKRFRDIISAHVIVLGVGYLGYMLVPARGPRLFLPDIAPLRGALGYYEFAMHNWTAMQSVVYDAFPSLHTANATLAVAHSLRNRHLFRPLPWLITPPSVLLIGSTLYLRMHYAIDVLAGLLLALGAAWVAPRLGPYFDSPDRAASSRKVRVIA